MKIHEKLAYEAPQIRDVIALRSDIMTISVGVEESTVISFTDEFTGGIEDSPIVVFN